MVGRLVDQQEAVFPREQQRQQELGLFSGRKRSEAAIEQRLVEGQRRHLAQQAPFLQLRMQRFQDLPGRPLRPGHAEREVVAVYALGDAALIVVFSRQQAQEGGLAAAVAPGEAKLPVCVDLRPAVFKNRVKAAGIGETEVFDLDQ